MLFSLKKFICINSTQIDFFILFYLFCIPIPYLSSVRKYKKHYLYTAEIFQDMLNLVLLCMYFSKKKYIFNLWGTCRYVNLNSFIRAGCDTNIVWISLYYSQEIFIKIESFQLCGISWCAQFIHSWSTLGNFNDIKWKVHVWIFTQQISVGVSIKTIWFNSLSTRKQYQSLFDWEKNK